MKKFILITSIISLLTACSNGGSSSGGTTTTTPFLPSVPDSVNQVALNQLFTSDNCIDVGGGLSQKRYFTKISSDELKLESDVFDKPNCNLATTPIILVATKVVVKINGYTLSQVAGFQSLKLQQKSIEWMALDLNYQTYLEQTYTINGPWSNAVYRNMSGENNITVNGHLSNSEFKFVNGLLTFSGTGLTPKKRTRELCGS
jgi:hypothetical protein